MHCNRDEPSLALYRIVKAMAGATLHERVLHDDESCAPACKPSLKALMAPKPKIQLPSRPGCLSPPRRHAGGPNIIDTNVGVSHMLREPGGGGSRRPNYHHLAF